MLPGTIVAKILDEISPAIEKNLNFIESGIFKKKIQDFKDNLFTLTSAEEKEIRQALIKIKDLLNKELI
jgi:hypothetical protein